MQRTEPERLIERSPPRLLTPVAEPVWIGFPRSLTSFFGRTREIMQLQRLLRDPDQRLITLLGPGGVGKTRLAIAASEELDGAFPDGAAFLNLTAATSLDHAASLIAETLGVRGQAGHTTTQSLVAAIQSRRMLLVMDNLEQLISPDLRALLTALLESCPHLTILATSREPLQMRQEQRVVVAPLATPLSEPGSPAPAAWPAVQLFVARARSIEAGFTLLEPDVETVAEICCRLDGLPLAIELAAAWVRLLSLPALLERLGASLPLLTGGPADQPARFQTMRAAIAWSWDRLTPDEARLLRRLAVFRGGFTLEAAAAVGLHDAGGAPEVPGEALRLIAALADRSLLVRSDSVGATQRFTLLETVREYALEQLAAAGDQPTIARIHAHYYLALTERVAPELFGREERFWISQYRADHANLRAAVSWGLAHDAELAIRICYALAWLLSWYGLRDGVVWLAEALRAPEQLPPLVRSRGLYLAASLASLTGDNAATGELGEAARLAALEAGDAIAEGLACWMVGVCHAYGGDFTAADRILDHGHTLMEQAVSPTDLTVAGYMHSTSGMIALAQGNRGRSLTHYDRAVELLTRSGSPLITTIVFSDYACVLLELGNMPRARALLQEAARCADLSALTWEGATTLVGLALADAMEGFAESAARRLGAFEAIWQRADIAIPPYYQARLDRITDLAQAQLDAFTFAAGRAAGSAQYRDVLAAMTDDDAPAMAGGALARDTARKLGLTRRELEVFQLLTAGQADREIAASLFISVRTASKHVGAILQKLGASSRSEAVVQGMKLGLA